MNNSELYKEIADDFCEKLQNYEGRSYYGCDLAFAVFESYNIDGTVTYNRYEAETWIKKHFSELGDIVKDMADGWDYNAGLDIFDNPEKFMTSCYLWVANELCGQSDIINEVWNDDTELTADLIQKISAEIKELC